MAVIPNDDYLWDLSGPPDEEVIALERMLAPLARDGRPVAPPAPRSARGWLALAAGLALIAAAWSDLGPSRLRESDQIRLRVAGRGAGLRAGSWFVARTEARELELGDVGRLTLSAGSRLFIRRLAVTEASFYLARGELSAQVSVEARPRFFQVGTPATTCVDLGCAYTLTVDDSGDAVVAVQSGRVAFENEGREVFVPAGATCRAVRGVGQGTPRFMDAPEALVRAVDAFDAAARARPEQRRGLAHEVLRHVENVRDALVAWHFLQDRDDAIARAAQVRLAEIAGGGAGRVRESERPTAEDCRRWKQLLEAEWW
jgi:hypothetical protein